MDSIWQSWCCKLWDAVKLKTSLRRKTTTSEKLLLKMFSTRAETYFVCFSPQKRKKQTNYKTETDCTGHFWSFFRKNQMSKRNRWRTKTHLNPSAEDEMFKPAHIKTEHKCCNWSNLFSFSKMKWRVLDDAFKHHRESAECQYIPWKLVESSDECCRSTTQRALPHASTALRADWSVHNPDGGVSIPSCW